MATYAPTQNEEEKVYRPSRKRKGGRLFRVALGLVLLLVAGAGSFYGWMYWRLWRSLPQVDGSVSVQGISAPATVVRDMQGVPHITAATVEDALFAQGYVTAQDRLWQMDATRRFAAGELAEILGSVMLEHDRVQRYLQLRHAAEAAGARLSGEPRRQVEAYVAGVNAYIESHRDRLPLEFTLLGYQPRAWTVTDTLLMGANMSQMLNTQFETELLREKVAAKLTPEEVRDLYPSTSWRDRPPGSDHPNMDEDAPPKKTGDEDDDDDGPVTRTGRSVAPRFTATEREDCELCVPGSNNWVVSGEHTASGKPLLSNDMHLAHTVPSIWYEAHLKAGDLDVAGVTLPGIPFVIVGHNQHIAWGFTNLGPDVQDVFIEQFNSAGQVATPEGFREAEHRREIVHVKGAADTVLDVVVTRHGPIVTPILAAMAPNLAGETRPLALQWTIYDPAILSSPFYQIDTAKNWQEFRAAFAQFAGPGQNVVYADSEGHIGYQATGRVPIRAAGDGLTPQSGADAAHDWIGYLPFEQMPSVFDPASGVLATANNRVTPDGYKPLLATQWFSPYRAERIYRVLESKSGLKPADMLELQTDVYSALDRFFADRFVYAIDNTKNVPDRVKQAAELMRGWDGRMDKNSVAPTLANVSRRNFARLLLAPKLGADFTSYSWGTASVAMENMLTRKPAHWLPKGYASYDDLLVAAVKETVSPSTPAKDLPVAPADLKTWRWGSQVALDLNHPVFGRIPLLASLSGTGRYEQSGSGSTVKQTGRAFGPSQRMTVDFSNLDASTLNIVVGQSGNPLSPHFKDHFPAWYGATTFTLPFSDAAVAQAKEHELKLLPAR